VLSEALVQAQVQSVEVEPQQELVQILLELVVLEREESLVVTQLEEELA
jgi:hypothetical protein